MKLSHCFLVMFLSILGWETPDLLGWTPNKLIFPNAQNQVFQDLSTLYKEIPFEPVKDQNGLIEIYVG